MGTMHHETCLVVRSDDLLLKENATGSPNLPDGQVSLLSLQDLEDLAMLAVSKL